MPNAVLKKGTLRCIKSCCSNLTNDWQPLKTFLTVNFLTRRQVHTLNKLGQVELMLYRSRYKARFAENITLEAINCGKS